MSATDAPTPTIRNPGRTPATPRKLFVTVPVADVQRTIDFYEGLGFTFDPRFTNPGGAGMLVGQDAHFMFVTREQFAHLSERPAVDPRKAAGALFSFAAESRETVDAIVHRAIALGGAPAHQPEDHGFMYDWSFYDPDGHGWGVFWMDPAAAQG